MVLGMLLAIPLGLAQAGRALVAGETCGTASAG
jgi:hypothetical protein